MTTTHRLQHPHDRAAAGALRQSHIDKAFDLLAAAGHLHIVGDDLTMYRHVLARWWDANRAGREHPMVDRRTSTRRQLNRLAHLLRQVNRELGADEIEASGDRRFAVGDRVTARSPNRDLRVHGDRHAYVRNGALGTVVAITHHPRHPERDALTVDFDGSGRSAGSRRRRRPHTNACPSSGCSRASASPSDRTEQGRLAATKAGPGTSDEDRAQHPL